MMADTGFLFGHAIYLDGTEWRFLDTDELTADTWKSRACGVCDKHRTAEGHDACIADLPGVVNACCGHGQPREAYASFESGERLGGHDAIRFFEKENRMTFPFPMKRVGHGQMVPDITFDEHNEGDTMDTKQETKQGHTKGDWFIDGETDAICVGTVAIAHAEDLGTERRHEFYANVRLIASAPALLSLAQGVALLFKDTDAPLGIKAREIIRRVTGEVSDER